MHRSAAMVLDGRSPQTISMLTLDHVVHLSSPKTLESTIAALSSLFVIVEGGTHAGGLTCAISISCAAANSAELSRMPSSNSLIILPSGAYVELVQFLVDDPCASGHVWGKKAPGTFIDYAMLGSPTEEERHRVKVAGGPGEHYAPSSVGGRKTPSGEVLECALNASPFRHKD